MFSKMFAYTARELWNLFASYVIILFKILLMVFYLFHLYTKYKVISFVCNIDTVCILSLVGLNLISMLFV